MRASLLPTTHRTSAISGTRYRTRAARPRDRLAPRAVGILLGEKIIKYEDPLEPDLKQGGQIAPPHLPQHQIRLSPRTPVPVDRNGGNAVATDQSRQRQFNSDIEVTGVERHDAPDDVSPV